MGEVIRLEDRRARRRPETVGDTVRAEFLFDHGFVDGGPAAAFLQEVGQVMGGS